MPSSLDISSTEFSSHITSILNEEDCPSASIVLCHNGTSHAATYGNRRLGEDNPSETSNLHMIGPISSTFIPIMIARLVERNLVSWDSQIFRLLNDEIQDIHSAHRNTTVLMLCTHISGITTKLPELQDGALVTDLLADNLNGRDGRHRIASFVLASAPERQPGPDSSYRNAVNLIILALIIEKLCDIPYEQALQEEVFGSMGLSSFGFGFPRREVKMRHPHHAKNNAICTISSSEISSSPWLSVSATFPTLGLHCNLEDLSKYLQCQLRTAHAFDTITASHWEFLHAQAEGSHFTSGGFDTISTDWSSAKTLRCTGQVTGYSVGVWLVPDAQLGFIILLNIDGEKGAQVRDKIYQIMAKGCATLLAQTPG